MTDQENQEKIQEIKNDIVLGEKKLEDLQTNFSNLSKDFRSNYGFVEFFRDAEYNDDLTALNKAEKDVADQELYIADKKQSLINQSVTPEQRALITNNAVLLAQGQNTTLNQPLANGVANPNYINKDALKAAQDKAAADLKADQERTAAEAAALAARTQEEIAADERLEAQCALIDFLPQIAAQNYAWRTDLANEGTELNRATGGGGKSNPYMFGMWGDGDTFSSYVNGSKLKAKFLDFTTAQLSSLVPILKFYKVNTNENGKTTDYLIPFPTHAGWTGGRSSQGNVVKNDKTKGFNVIIKDSEYHKMDANKIDANIISNVGIKSFDWKYQGTNPVSTKIDIKADLVLFAKNLSDILEPFVVYSIDGDKSKFRYVDFILRSGTIFKENKQYNPDYYRIKVQIGWGSENKELFTDEERKSLYANTSTLFLTLTDHSFAFDQDGSFSLSMNYRAYFESLFASDDADFLRSADQQAKLDGEKEKMSTLKETINSEAADEDGTPDSGDSTAAQKELDTLTKAYAEEIDILNKVAFERIIDSLSALNAIYYAQIDTALYPSYKASIGTAQIERFDINKVFIFNPASLSDISTAAKKAMATDLSAEGNPNLNNFIPKEVDGKKTLSFFYLGDLLYVALYEAYLKLDTAKKPIFVFGSALYKDPQNTSKLKYVNILDIPVSVEWFTEWFTSTIVAQDKTTYPILYFIRDLCSKLITNIMSKSCDKSGDLKMRNRFNTLNFVLKDQSRIDFYNKKNSLQQDIAVTELQTIVNNNYLTINEPVDTSKTQEYVAIYCQDRTTPQKVDFCTDLEQGRYHFYFGRDRGLVKKINFTREQTTGLRELNYVRDSTGIGLEQLMLPYNVEITMVGNNLMYNGMMIYIDPSGFGRKIGQTDDPESVSYKLKLGGYHIIYGVQNHLGVDGYETKIQAKWVGSGRSSSVTPTAGVDTGTVYGLGEPLIRADTPPERKVSETTSIKKVTDATAAATAVPTAVAPGATPAEFKTGWFAPKQGKI